MAKKTIIKKSVAGKRSSAKKMSAPKSRALTQVRAAGFAVGDQVKCIIDMGHVGSGGVGKIMGVIPEMDAIVVRFGGASHDTMVALTDVQAISYEPGNRVKCTINIGLVPAGTTGTVMESVPAADASKVEFDGYPGPTRVPNDLLVPA